jgi:hypothetical protein
VIVVIGAFIFLYSIFVPRSSEVIAKPSVQPAE